MCHYFLTLAVSFVSLKLYSLWLPTSEYAEYSSWAQILGSIANGVTITVLNQVYSVIAEKLTKWENHETESSYQNSLIMKTFTFQFVNSFLTLFYTAFVDRDMETLSERLMSILVSKQIIDNIKEFVVPMYNNKRL